MLQSAGAEAFLLEMLPELGVGVATLTGDGTVRAWNACAARLTGYSALEVNVRGLAQLFEPSQRLAQCIEQAKSGIATARELLTLQRANGQSQPVVLWCLPLSSPDDSAAQILVMIRALVQPEPVTESVDTREQLQLLGQLASSVSHEIHNPLNAILLHADVLEEELSQPEGGSHDQLLHSLAVIKTRITQLYEMIQEYLTLARLSDLPCHPEDLGALLEAFGLEMRERLAAHGITLHLEEIAGLGYVALYKPIFWQALSNIIQYATKTMPHGGRITLRGRRIETSIQLDISDTGEGLAEAQWSTVLQPSPTARYEAKELGLYLVREVVAAHQGKITVASTPHQGTIFTIVLPCRTSAGSRE
jgi:PAS domain S-box-containing protein